MSDSGMVAVLDPRLLKTGPYRYQEQTRQMYMKALSRFERKISNLDEAVQFLRAQHGSASATAA
jgi:ATP-dependent DNA helicase DinG